LPSSAWRVNAFPSPAWEREKWVAALDEAKIKASFKKHASEPDVSINEYVRKRRIELGRSVTHHKLIYLDTCYWIILRDVLLGSRTDASNVRLLDCLRLQAQKHEVICPISESVFIELLKQQDRRTRRKIAELIDELSFGVTLAPEEERIGTELAHFFYSHDERSSIYPLKWLIWSKLSYVLGVVIPTNTGLGPDIELAMQKVCFDHMWDCSLTEIVDTLSDAPPPEFDSEALASRLNEVSARHASKIQSFNQVYANEIEGSLSLYMPVARTILEDMSERGKGVTPRISDAEQKEHERQLLSFFVQAFRKPKIAKLSPTLHINVLGHASVRWDKQRKFKGNDFHDFHHAAAAVPYCDVFLTETPLRVMLEQNHLRINQDFGCRIISSVSEAVECLEKE
jgi:hypothetical protein